VPLGDTQRFQIRNSFEYFRPRGREEEEEEEEYNGNDDDEEGRNCSCRDVRFRLPAQHKRERR
jgi:hypothetical protein